MAKMTIRVPDHGEKEYTGKMYGLTWIDGKAETEDRELADHLALRGYIVEGDYSEPKQVRQPKE